jgi:hypothetical protein
LEQPSFHRAEEIGISTRCGKSSVKKPDVHKIIFLILVVLFDIQMAGIEFSVCEQVSPPHIAEAVSKSSDRSGRSFSGLDFHGSGRCQLGTGHSPVSSVTTFCRLGVLSGCVSTLA